MKALIYFNPSLLWLMVGLRGREKIQRPLSRLQRKGIRFINASVQRIDFDDRIVHTSGGSEPFDYLVIALGASTFPEKIPGFSEAACNPILCREQSDRSASEHAGFVTLKIR
ncbi:FAD/NAD(P)-binding oxidoreductase [Candidatus Kuenenia sp.]|uniref:FAD/NAD(P)-binding oxidoreductase n=1 Tax=Candidatus Kuenenia sp. TaxID=2499824 RepID=UPI0032202186